MDYWREGKMDIEGHLKLRWNDHTLTFVHLLDHYRLQELYCDASLACAGGGVYPVHKVVLSACSDFFASIFASASCQNPVVVLQDVATEHLEALLTYVYRGEVLLARPDLPAFLKVAESLQVKGLAPPPLIPFPRDNFEAITDATRFSNTPTRPPQPLPPPPYPHSEIPSPPTTRCDGTWDSEGVSGRGVSVPTPPRAPGSCQRNGESLRPLRKRFSPHFAATEQFGGTFQNMVVSEERGGIKEEPVEENSDYLESDILTICEREEEEEEKEEKEEEMVTEQQEEEKEGRDKDDERLAKKQVDNQRTQEEVMQRRKKEEVVVEEEEVEEEEEEEEGRVMEVKIMLDSRQHPEIMNTSTTTHSQSPFLPIHSPTPSHVSYSPHSHSSLSPTPAHHARSPTQPHSLSPTPAHPAHSPVPATPTPTSQLRRELLKPLQYRFAPHHHPSIPHPVIASMDGGEGGVEGVEGNREPPPLVKISPVSPISEHESTILYHYRQRHQYQSDGREDTTPTPTSTPTTFTTITTPPPFTTTPPNKTHHLLVTTQPTYRARPPPIPQATAVPPTTYPPPLTQYKDLHLMDSDAPLNLSQDAKHGPTRTHHTHHRRTHHQERHREGDPFLGKILTNRKRRLRGPKSWEYLVRLLRDPTTNPSLIRWENEAKGVFRLVQPAAIAQKWGRRTGKHASECLSYENFARGLRYHYATGALEPVSERSFVYKFGPKAILALGDGECGVTSGEVTVTSGGDIITHT